MAGKPDGLPPYGEEYLKPDYAPEAVADRCGMTALRIRAAGGGTGVGRL
jgi:hypothetical protein